MAYILYESWLALGVCDRRDGKHSERVCRLMSHYRAAHDPQPSLSLLLLLSFFSLLSFFLSFFLSSSLFLEVPPFCLWLAVLSPLYPSLFLCLSSSFLSHSRAFRRLCVPVQTHDDHGDHYHHHTTTTTTQQWRRSVGLAAGVEEQARSRASLFCCLFTRVPLSSQLDKHATRETCTMALLSLARRRKCKRICSFRGESRLPSSTWNGWR